MTRQFRVNEKAALMLRVELVLPNAAGPLAEIVPPATNRYYTVQAVDTRGNVSPF